MGVKFKVGDELKQIMPAPIVGKVADISINTNDIQYTLEYVSADGVVHTKHFTEDQVEAA